MYLSLAPKSNALYTAYGRAVEDIQKTAQEPVPLHLRNSVTKLMKGMGYGRDYQYAHDYDDAITNMSCLPDSLAGSTYYQPTSQGFEERLRKRLEEIKHLKSKNRAPEK